MADAAEDKGPPEEEGPTGDSGTAEGGDELETIEVVTEATDEDGDVVVDDLIVEVDGQGHIIATDETTIIRTTQGDVLVDETFSVAGDDGTLHVVDEDMTVLEAGDATVRPGEEASRSGEEASRSGEEASRSGEEASRSGEDAGAGGTG